MQVDDFQKIPTRPIGALPRAIVYITLLCALLSLLAIHLGQKAPIWDAGSSNWPQAMMEQQVAGQERIFMAAAGDKGDLSLHCEGFDQPTPQQGRLMCQCYFLANYALYPHRAFIGKGDRIINQPTDLIAADTLPDEAWRHGHGINSVLVLHHGVDGDHWQLH